MNPTSACSTLAALLIPLQSLILILTFWFSAGEEIVIDLTGESSEPEVIVISDDESGVVSSEWHTPLHLAVKLVFLPVFWHLTKYPGLKGWNMALIYHIKTQFPVEPKHTHEHISIPENCLQRGDEQPKRRCCFSDLKESTGIL